MFVKKFWSFIYTKKILYILTVVVGNFCLVCDLYLERTLSMAWVAAFTALTGFVTTGYLGGKYLIRKENP